MSHDLICWQCGASLAHAILPMSRRETCKACDAEQHVCRLCQHYDARVSDQCREERAEQVSNKELANFCDYFAPRAGAWLGESGAVEQQAAAEQLAALFGDAPVSKDPGSDVSDELKDLFGLDQD